MKSATVVLALALLGAGECAADPRDLTSEQRMFADALMLEREGKGPEAVKAYIRAAKAGSAKAARRLAEIYGQGIPGVARDYPESLKWHNAARALGDDPVLPDADRRAMEEAKRRVAEDALRREDAKQDRARIMPPVLRWETPRADPFDVAVALEQAGKGAEAVKIYERAARAGNGKAARRLADIYDKGIPGVARDYALSLRWYNAARVLGEDVPPAKR